LVRHDANTASPTLGVLADRINDRPRPIRLEIDDDLRGYRLVEGTYLAPSYHALIARIVSAHDDLCIAAHWPEGAQGVVAVRRRGDCAGR
jgi:hypothetical protein